MFRLDLELSILQLDLARFLQDSPSNRIHDIILGYLSTDNKPLGRVQSDRTGGGESLERLENVFHYLQVNCMNRVRTSLGLEDRCPRSLPCC